MYAVSNLTESTSDVVKKGLFRYYQFERWCPRGVGILAFGKTYGANAPPPPFMSDSTVKYALYAVICLLLMVGIYLIWRVLRKK